MTELLTAAQMRAIEQAAIDSGEVTGLELMERAGKGVVEAIFEEWPELAQTSHRAVVLCGPGNNGGDGFVVARLLHDCGWEVEVFLYGDAEKLPPDARVNYERWCERGGVVPLSLSGPTAEEVEKLYHATKVTFEEPGPAIILDALFGTGLSRPTARLANLVQEIQIGHPVEETRPPYVVSVDIASGVCSDSGRILGDAAGVAIGAHLTVCFHSMKRGHFLNDGPNMSGRVVLKSIGLEARRNPPSWVVLAQLYGIELKKPGHLKRYKTGLISQYTAMHPILPKAGAHKYTHGHALILSGPAGQTGAARLAARGALRVGAGLLGECAKKIA